MIIITNFHYLFKTFEIFHCLSRSFPRLEKILSISITFPGFSGPIVVFDYKIGSPLVATFGLRLGTKVRLVPNNYILS